MRSERLLSGMHKAVSHDLPNQVVAVRGLLKLLSQEESSRLSDDGREYLRRLQSATERAGEIARFLKEIERLQAYAPTPKTIVLTDMARELQGALRQRHPGHGFEFAWQWKIPALVGDPSALARGLREVFAGLLKSRGARWLVSGASGPRNAAVEVQFVVTPMPAADSRESGVTPALQDRLEIVLAREWLALTGAELELAASDEAVRFSFVLPSSR